MKKILIIFLFFFLFSFSFLISFALACRPLMTDDAYVTEINQSEFESSITYFKFRDQCNFLNLVTTAKYGLLPYFETAFDLIFSFWNRAGIGESGLSDVNLKAKYVLADFFQNQLKFTLGLTYKPATGDYEKILGSGTNDFFLNLITSWKFKKITGHANFGYNMVISGPISNYFWVALAGEFPLFEKNTGFLELTSKFFSGSNKKVINFGMGINQKLSENVITDTAINFGLSGEAPEYTITSGWKFKIN